MFRRCSKTLFLVVIISVWMAGTDLYGQQQSIGNQSVKDSSLAHFERGDFRLALSGFRTLMQHAGSDPGYSYYAGRCLVELNEGLDEAIELLYGASRNEGYPDALFYLGKAYQRNYNFEDARRCFESYEMNAGRQKRKELNVKHLIATCRSGSEITSMYNPFEVMNVTFLDLSDSLQYSQVKMKGGELGRKPELYFQADEDPEGLTSLMFNPKDPVRGDYIYYSGYGRGGKDGAQIFRVRKGSGKSWGDPEEVPALNSSGNEILPYYDPIENDLYFASDGRLGVGGYDLYKAHYDTGRDQWTMPVNLGFPVNSVMDEYLLLPGSDLGMVLFFSNRQGADSAVTVYRVHLVEPKRKTPLNDHRKVMEIAQLGGVADEILAGLNTGEPDKEKDERPEVTDPAIVIPVTNRKVETPKTLYQETLSEALRHQVLSDSLKDLAMKARVLVKESEDPNDRWVWQKQIVVWEKKARDEESIADQLYGKMEKERIKSSPAPAVNPPETIVADRVIGDLTVYRFRDPDPGLKDPPEDLPAPEDLPGENTNAAPSGKVNRFEILSHSPYSTVHPIPMDVVLPAGTFYRIQLGAFAYEVEPDVFGGISPITGEHLKERGLVKYYVGKFSCYEEASASIPRIHSMGYEDAFIVAWYNGNPISTQKAKQLE